MTPDETAPASSSERGRGFRFADLSLVGVLAVALAAELLLDRLGARLIALEPLAPLGRLRAFVEVAGPFSFYFASVLSVLLAALGLLRLLAQPAGLADAMGESPPAGAVVARGLLVMALVGFVFVTALGVVLLLPERLRLYRLALFLLLALLLVRGAFRLPSMPARARLWFGLYVLAALLNGLWIAALAFELESVSTAPRLLLSVGEALVVTLAAIAPACFPTTGRSPGAALLGLLAGGGALALANRDWPTAARVAAYGFGVELPMPATGVALYALALALLVFAIARLLARGGTARLRGWGLLILALSGYQLDLPYQRASVLVGLLCLIDSYQRQLEGWLPTAAFRALLRRLAGSVAASDVTIVGAAGSEEARMHGASDGEPIEIVLLRRAGALATVEVVVGKAPDREPPRLSLLRRGATRLGRKAGPEVPTGDERFDRAFTVNDARTLRERDPLLGDDALRARLLARLDGWLGVWPGGTRFRSASPSLLRTIADPAGEPALRELLSLLADVARRSNQ